MRSFIFRNDAPVPSIGQIESTRLREHVKKKLLFSGITFCVGTCRDADSLTFQVDISAAERGKNINREAVWAD